MNKVLLDNAFCHAVSVIGLAIAGQPKLGEPLDAAVQRVQESEGMEDPVLAVQAAGIRAIIDHPGEDASRTLFDAVPAWLAAFALAQVDAHVLGWPARDLSAVPPFTSACNREALDAWPGLPRGPAIFKEAD